MAQARTLIPIVCENDQCKNNGNVFNIVSGINLKEIDLFYDGYDESVDQDHCPICGQLGIVEDPIRIDHSQL